MPSLKEKDELKMRLAKLSQAKADLHTKAAEPYIGPVAQVPAPQPMAPPMIPRPVAQSTNSNELEALNEEFEAKRREIMEKQSQVREEMPEPSGVEEVVDEMHNEGKFRVELLIQLVALNKTMSSIDLKLGKLLG